MHKAASILLLLLVSSVGIAAAGDGTKLLTLDVAMELALKNSPRLKALHAAIDAAETLPRAARYPRNPELRLSGESSDRNQEGISRSRTDYSASVRVFPRSPWEKRIAAKLLENEVRVAEAELWTARHEIRVRIMELFSALGFLRKDIELLDQLVEIRADRIAVLERLLESSETTASDLLAAKFEHSEALRLKSEAVRESKAARREIAWLVGADFDEVNTSPLTMPELEEAHLEHLLKLAVDTRPEVGFAFYQYREAGLDLDLARTSRRPWLSFVEGGYTQESGWRSGDAWEIRVGMDIPIFPDSDNHVGARKAGFGRGASGVGEIPRCARGV
jgi:outer membrane protein TolC